MDNEDPIEIEYSVNYNFVREQPSSTVEELRNQFDVLTNEIKTANSKLDDMQKEKEIKKARKIEKYTVFAIEFRDKFLVAENIDGQVSGKDMNTLFRQFLIANGENYDPHEYKKVFEAAGLKYARPGGQTFYQGFKLKYDVPTIVNLINIKPEVPTSSANGLSNAPKVPTHEPKLSVPQKLRTAQ